MMSDFAVEKNPIARGVYRCSWCPEKIVVGEKHYHFVGKWEGDFQNWRMHTECEVAFREETEDGEICSDGHKRGQTCSTAGHMGPPLGGVPIP